MSSLLLASFRRVTLIRVRQFFTSNSSAADRLWRETIFTTRLTSMINRAVSVAQHNKDIARALDADTPTPSCGIRKAKRQR